MARAYRKKPVVVEAVRWTGENHGEMCEFIDPEVFEIIPRVGLVIHTLEGDHHASLGDYIIKGVNGEFYPCKPDIFEKTYEHATLTPPNEPMPVLVNDEPDREYIDYICPRCKDIISQRRRGQRMETVYQCKYHDNCGQRMDWSNPQPYRRPPEGGEINKITVVQHLGRLEDVAFRPVSREQVEKVWRGEWIIVYDEDKEITIATCSKCGDETAYGGSLKADDCDAFCPVCGAPMTDEAVDIIMRRLETLYETT